MKKTITREVDVELCDKCNDELFDYDYRGQAPRSTYGVIWGDGDNVFCSRKCQEAIEG